MGRRLILKDKTTIENGVAGFADGFLWLHFPTTGQTFTDVVTTFCDPEKTGVIVFQYGEMQDEYIGYTKCVSITVSETVAVCLTK